LLYAGAAIGVSHLVQSTRAGAEYSWLPVIGIVFIHLAKFPFFKMGPEYAAHTGESLIEAYRKLGKWALFIFGFFTVGTMFAIIAAIVAVNAGIAGYIFNIDLEPSLVAGIVLIFAMAILLIGQYTVLDRFINFVIILLSVSTLLAFVLSLKDGTGSPPMDLIFDGAFLIMMIKLMGWMPAPLDLSVWHSIWVVEKSKRQDYDFKKSMQDFKIGYWGTMIIGILFLGVGAMVLYPSPDLPNGGVAFANMFIGVYTSKLGGWTFGIVAFAALTTMFSTALTCLDAIPRSLSEIFKSPSQSTTKLYTPFLIVLSVGSFALLHFWAPGMLTMVDLATILSFCATPVIAYLNFRSIKLVEKSRPGALYEFYTKGCLILLTLFTLIFLIYYFQN
jgi:Mn2+/Fe2+ NRAMP family transporter